MATVIYLSCPMCLETWSDIVANSQTAAEFYRDVAFIRDSHFTDHADQFAQELEGLDH